MNKAAKQIIKSALNDKKDIINNLAQEISNYKFENVSTYKSVSAAYASEYIIVALGSSSRHIISATDKMRQFCRKNLDLEVNIDAGSPYWIVIDAGFCIIHLMTRERHEKYEFDKLLASIGENIE